MLPGFEAPFDKELGLVFTELSPDRTRGPSSTSQPKLLQPMGIVHGGVYCSMVESLASVAAYTWIDANGGGSVVGVNNNTDFLRAIGSGTVYGAATPVHRGRRQQLWMVTITDSDDRLVARGQVRLQNLEADHPLLANGLMTYGETPTLTGPCLRCLRDGYLRRQDRESRQAPRPGPEGTVHGPR